VRSVLDVGCGEGNWSTVLREIRPRARYLGVDGSEYAVRRFGARRNIRLGTLGTINEIGLSGPFDLILCLGVLNYVAADELRRGLKHLRTLSGGVAYLEIFTRADDASGDFTKSKAPPAAWYREVIRRAGFVALGLHCYLPRDLAGHAAALERAETGTRA
jgi:SAM-dependent methyltransferase